MKKILLVISLILMTATSLIAQKYPKVILSGDYPDPSIMRDGKDYYMTHSPFYYMPGFLIWHSQDLMNWEPVKETRHISRFIPRRLAGHIIRYNFTIYFQILKTNILHHPFLIIANDM